MATVLRAKTAGFCMGVGLALRKLDQALKEHRAAAPAGWSCSAPSSTTRKS